MEVLEFKNMISEIMNSVSELNRLDSDKELVNWKTGQKEVANGSTETKGQKKSTKKQRKECKTCGAR